MIVRGGTTAVDPVIGKFFPESADGLCHLLADGLDVVGSRKRGVDTDGAARGLGTEMLIGKGQKKWHAVSQHAIEKREKQHEQGRELDGHSALLRLLAGGAGMLVTNHEAYLTSVGEPQLRS